MKINDDGAIIFDGTDPADTDAALRALIEHLRNVADMRQLILNIESGDDSQRDAPE